MFIELTEITIDRKIVINVNHIVTFMSRPLRGSLMGTYITLTEERKNELIVSETYGELLELLRAAGQGVIQQP